MLSMHKPWQLNGWSINITWILHLQPMRRRCHRRSIQQTKMHCVAVTSYSRYTVFNKSSVSKNAHTRTCWESLWFQLLVGTRNECLDNVSSLGRGMFRVVKDLNVHQNHNHVSWFHNVNKVKFCKTSSESVSKFSCALSFRSSKQSQVLSWS